MSTHNCVDTTLTFMYHLRHYVDGRIYASLAVNKCRLQLILWLMAELAHTLEGDKILARIRTTLL